MADIITRPNDRGVQGEVDAAMHRATESRAVGSCSIRLLQSRGSRERHPAHHAPPDRPDRPDHGTDSASPCASLWFVTRGRLLFTDQAASRAGAPGDLVVVHGPSPCPLLLQPDADGLYAALHVSLPAAMLRDYPGCDGASPLILHHDRREVAIAQTIFTGLLRPDDRLGEPSARAVMDAALTVIGHAIRAEAAGAPARQTIADRRLMEVLRFIEVHLSDPNLSTSMVAKGCGISPRYLSFLLRLRGTGFSELVWEQRLAKAKLWLYSALPHDISISEIAYGVGFKSPAHFSRTFKRAFGMNPSEFRIRTEAEHGVESAPRRMGGGLAL